MTLVLRFHKLEFKEGEKQHDLCMVENIVTIASEEPVLLTFLDRSAVDVKGMCFSPPPPKVFNLV